MNSWLWILIIVWTFLYLAWKLNSTAKFCLKFLLFAVVSVILATTPIPLMLFNPRSCKNALFPAQGLRFCAKHMLGIKCRVKGKENIVQNSGCVVVINHQSSLDLIVLAELWPIMDRCTVISKKEISYIWPFGLAAWLWGTIFIDRLNGSKARESIMKTGEIIRHRKARVLMFPEGTRSQKDKLLPFKKGAFHLAIASGSPVQPIVVNRYTFLGNKRFDEGDIEIDILPAISVEGLNKDDVSQLIDKTYHVMQNHFNTMSNSSNHVTTPNNNNDKSKDN